MHDGAVRRASERGRPCGRAEPPTAERGSPGDRADERSRPRRSEGARKNGRVGPWRRTRPATTSICSTAASTSTTRTRSTRGCARTRPCTSTPRNGVWGIARYAAVLGDGEGPDDVLERRRHPSRHRSDPDDDRHGRPRALEAPQAREQGLHAAARARQRAEDPRRVRRDHRHGVRAGRVRLRARHRRAAADDPDRRHARRRARGPRRPAAVVRRHGQRAERQRDRGAVRRGDARDGRATPSSARTRSRNARRSRPTTS